MNVQYMGQLSRSLIAVVLTIAVAPEATVASVTPTPRAIQRPGGPLLQRQILPGGPLLQQQVRPGGPLLQRQVRPGGPLLQRQVRPGGPLRQTQIRPVVPSAGLRWSGRRLGPHVFYGTISVINGTILTLRLRNGRLKTIDVTAAVANGDYSAPLFVGKPVSIDGIQSSTTFTATHVFRMTNLAALDADK